jgi:hypothetical protein
MAKHIELSRWLADNFDPPPHISTARRWVSQGRIYPEPIRAGAKIYVLPTAMYRKQTDQPKSILDHVREQAAQNNQR